MAATHHNLMAVAARPDFWRLLAARVVSQIADGGFQAALAGVVFFSPEKEPNPLAVTAGFAALLLPYSLVGPFVGVFLDRWCRRTSLGIANLVRAASVVPAAVCIWLGQQNILLLVAALVVFAVNRFFLAGLAAAQPHVVDAERLVTANSFASTVGTVCYIVSLGAAGAAVRAAGTAPHHYAIAALVATAGYLLSGVMLMGWFSRRQLGPDDASRPTSTVVQGVADTVRGMVAGLGHLTQRPRAATILLAQAGHRMLFGLLTIMTLLLYRNHYAIGDPGKSLQGLLPVVAASAAGSLLAAVITPPLVRRLGSPRWVLLFTAALAIFLPALEVPVVASLTVIASMLVALGAQSMKIVTDTTLQIECDDDYRGRVFSVNDTGYNILFVTGLLVGALALPDDGVSTTVTICAGLGYALVAIGYAVADSRTRPRNPSTTVTEHAPTPA